MKIWLWVPISFIQKALKEKLHREVSMYLLLSMKSPGFIYLTENNRESVKHFFKISDHQFYRYIRTLKDLNWVGFDSVQKVYFIRGLKFIAGQQNFHSKSGVKIHLHDLLEFQVFCFSVAVGTLVRYQKRKRRRRGRHGVDFKLGESNQAPASPFRPVALDAMQQIFQLSKNTNIKLKKRAVELGYLKVEKSIEVLHRVDQHSSEYYRIHPESWGKLRRKGFMVGEQYPDKFVDQLQFKTLK